MDLALFKSLPVLAWLLWCTGVAGGFLVGMAFRSLVDPVGEGGFDRTLDSAEPAARPESDQAGGGPPKGPPNITCGRKVELPKAYWDLLDGRLKIAVRS